MIDLHAIRAANPLPSIVGAAVKLQRVGNEYKACCPFHPDRSPSFTIFAGGERFHCFGCDASGDVLDYVQRAHSVGLIEAAEMLGAGRLSVVSIAVPAPAERADRTADARAIWEKAIPPAGTLAESYLASRGILGPLPAALRFARLPYGREPIRYPCLVAAVTGPDGQLCGIQRTYLAESGMGKAAVPKPKLSLGRIAGGATRCKEPADTLIVTEGLEDSLSAMQLFGLPAWSAAGAGMMDKMQLPPAVRTVIVGADNDETGQRAARKAAEAFNAQGRQARILNPAPDCKDFNDELRRATA